jgi:hypothetical protein
MSEGQVTTDHDIIRRWVEERDGTPTRVKGTEDKSGEGILRIDFAEPDEQLEKVSWDDFFRTFLHQDKTADGRTSRFFKFIRRNAA